MPFIVTVKRPDGLDAAHRRLGIATKASARVVSLWAVATLEERIVFDNKEWKAAGYDQPEGNERFWHHALILESEPSSSPRHDKVATVLFLHDGRVSRGHFLNSMNSIEAADRLVPESGGTITLPDRTITVEPTTYWRLMPGFEVRQHLDADDPHWSFLDDVHEMLWPTRDGYIQDGDNHVAQGAVIQALRERGCRPNIQRRWLTPEGFVEFDSEAGALGMYATTRGPIEFVLGVVDQMLSAEARARVLVAWNAEHGVTR